MSSWVVNLPDLVIANAGTVSGAIGSLEDADTVTIYGPTALTGTVTIQIEPSAAGTTWLDLTSGGSDVTIGVGNAVVIGDISFRQLRLSSSAAEGAERIFRVTKQFQVGGRR